MKKLLLFSVIIALCACSKKESGSESSSSASFGGYKIKSLNIQSSNKGLMLAKSKNSISSLDVSAQSSLADTLLRVDVNGEITEVSFTLEYISIDSEGNETPITEVRTIPISKIKNLNENFIVFKINQDNQEIGPDYWRYTTDYFMFDRTSGKVYEINALTFESVQMKGNNLYYIVDSSIVLNTQQIVRVDITDPELTIHYVTLDNAVVDNPQSMNATEALDHITNLEMIHSSPFQYTSNYIFGISPEFIFLKDDYILSRTKNAGHMALYKEGQSTHSCWGQDLPIFQTRYGNFLAPDGDLYQAVRMHIDNDKFDRVIKNNIDISPTSCFTDADIVQDLGDVGGNYVSSLAIYYKANYSITDTERYILSPNGFFKTHWTGSTINMTFTNLNFSAVPKNDNRSGKVILSGDSLYWLDNSTIYSLQLTSGAMPQVYHSGSGVVAFNVFGASIVFTDATGTYVVSSAGATPTFLSESLEIRDVISLP